MNEPTERLDEQPTEELSPSITLTVDERDAVISACKNNIIMLKRRCRNPDSPHYDQNDKLELNALESAVKKLTPKQTFTPEQFG